MVEQKSERFQRTLISVGERAALYPVELPTSEHQDADLARTRSLIVFEEKRLNLC